MTQRLAQAIATAVTAWNNCLDSGNDWADVWSERLDNIERECLPSGSGFDSGTTIERDKCNGQRLVLTTGFHHMNEHGYYDGWTQHTVTIRPSFVTGLDITISGRNRNDIKSYIAEMMHGALTAAYTWPTA